MWSKIKKIIAIVLTIVAIVLAILAIVCFNIVGTPAAGGLMEFALLNMGLITISSAGIIGGATGWIILAGLALGTMCIAMAIDNKAVDGVFNHVAKVGGQVVETVTKIAGKAADSVVSGLFSTKIGKFVIFSGVGIGCYILYNYMNGDSNDKD